MDLVIVYSNSISHAKQAILALQAGSDSDDAHNLGIASYVELQDQSRHTPIVYLLTTQIPSVTYSAMGVDQG